MRVIRNHFKRYIRRKPWDFCWRIAVESLVVSLFVAVFLSVLNAPERQLPDWQRSEIAAFAVLIAPPVETLVMQALPIFIARILKGSFGVQILAGTVVFSLFHIPEGIATFISAGIVGGFYFSFAYARSRRKSRWKAFWVTALSHAIHNGIAFMILLLLGF